MYKLPGHWGHVVPRDKTKIDLGEQFSFGWIADFNQNGRNEIFVHRKEVFGSSFFSILTFSFTVEPSSLSVSGNKFKDNVGTYKKFANNVFFGFTVGINIPLSPFDDPYDVNRIVKELLKLNYFEHQILYAKHKRKEDEHRLNLTILKEVYLLSEQNRKNMVNRVEAAKILLRQGYINAPDLTLQELDCRLANIYCLKARLDYIVEVLKY